MLSPNAMNRVAVMRGGAVTTTANEQFALRLMASVARHMTLVMPIGNIDGLGGAHVIETGEAPPVTVAAGYVTLTGWPSVDTCVIEAGQVIVGASGVGVGLVVESPQAPAQRAAPSAAASVRVKVPIQAPRTTDRSPGDVCRISLIA